mmetsp:Transcript_10461/g.29488  ORF Transcript_10461/g.29488 Transcript_10461/m.29488 type:complete len:140 (-) Transcript_10461:58-477(-)
MLLVSRFSELPARLGESLLASALDSVDTSLVWSCSCAFRGASIQCLVKALLFMDELSGSGLVKALLCGVFFVDEQHASGLFGEGATAAPLGCLGSCFGGKIQCLRDPPASAGFAPGFGGGGPTFLGIEMESSLLTMGWF